MWGVGHMMREVRPLPGPCRPRPGQPGPPSQGLRCGLEAAARVKGPRWVAPLGRNHSWLEKVRFEVEGGLVLSENEASKMVCRALLLEEEEKSGLEPERLHLQGLAGLTPGPRSPSPMTQEIMGSDTPGPMWEKMNKRQSQASELLHKKYRFPGLSEVGGQGASWGRFASQWLGGWGSQRPWTSSSPWGPCIAWAPSCRTGVGGPSRVKTLIWRRLPGACGSLPLEFTQGWRSWDPKQPQDSFFPKPNPVNVLSEFKSPGGPSEHLPWVGSFPPKRMEGHLLPSPFGGPLCLPLV